MSDVDDRIAGIDGLGIAVAGTRTRGAGGSRRAKAFCAGEFADLSAYVTTTEMAHNTTSAMVGPGIAYAFARSPFVHAAGVAPPIQRVLRRVFLGLGAGTSRMNRDWFGVDAATRLRGWVSSSK